MAPGRSRVSAFITVPDAMAVVRFAAAVFDAELVRPPLYRADGRLWNAELAIGDCTVLLGDADADMARPGFLYVHVPDAQATYDRAVAAGATPVMPPEKRFYGDLDGGVADAQGNLWWIATHAEDVAPDDVERRAREMEAT
jgi:PhnB protein